MTKKQAYAEFRAFYLPAIRRMEAEYGNGVDTIMRREEWNNYTDALCKDGQISLHQYETWDNPF